MSTWLEKLTIFLFLLIGLNVYNIAHSETRTDAKNDISNEVISCPVSGPVSLRLSGDLNHGQLVGSVNNQYVWWSVSFGRVTAFIDGHYISLEVTNESNYEYLLSGWIGTSYIRWMSFGGQFNEWVYCH